MGISFDQARAALAFLEQHQIEPAAVNYGAALVHLSGSYKALSQDIADLEEHGVRLTGARFVELITAHAAGLAAHDMAVPAESGLAARLAATERDLAELREQVAALAGEVRAGRSVTVDAEHDGLTNALNQFGARRILQQLGEQDQRYVVLMFGIDGLVAINREYGNSVGDNVLNAFAAKLSRIFPEQEAIRWAGNEFIVVIPGRTITAVRESAEEVLQLLERRKFRLRESGEAIGTVTASAAIVSDQGGDIESLIGQARMRLAEAMNGGGNRVVV